MQEDPLVESQSAMIAGDKTGQFYGMLVQCIYLLFLSVFAECPNGHKYFIGNVSLAV